MIFSNLFKNPKNMIISFQHILPKRTLKITIFKDPKINLDNFNIGLYSLDNLDLIGTSTYFMTKFNYEKSENSNSSETGILKEFRNNNLSKDNRFIFDRNKPIDEEEEVFKTAQLFIPLEVSPIKPDIQIKKYTINENYHNQFDFANIFHTMLNERLLFLCIYPDQSRLNVNLYDLNFEENNKIAFYQNYSYNIIFFSEKKNIAAENVGDSNINIKFEFKDKRKLQFNFNRDLSNIKCEYINVKNVSDEIYFIPKIDIKKQSSKGHGIDVNIIIEENFRKILL